MKLINIVILIFLFFSCRQPSQSPNEQNSIQDLSSLDSIQTDKNLAQNNSNINFIIFRTDTCTPDSIKGWGYDIYVDDKLMIHQPHIPAVAGKLAFVNQASAQMVANLVVYKLRNNIMPPSITIEDLDSIKIEY